MLLTPLRVLMGNWRSSRESLAAVRMPAAGAHAVGSACLRNPFSRMLSACLYHTYPFYCALAFEVTVPKHRPGKLHEIMELAAALVDARGPTPVLFGQFHSYVRPQAVPCIGEDVTARTGFTQAMADVSRGFPAVLEDLCRYLVDKGVIADEEVDPLASATWHRTGAYEGLAQRKGGRSTALHGSPYPRLSLRGVDGGMDGSLGSAGRASGHGFDDRWRAGKGPRASVGEPQMLVVTSGDWGIRDVLTAQCALSGVPLPLFLGRPYCNVKEAFAQCRAYTGVTGRVSSGALGLNQITSFLQLPCSNTTYTGMGVPRGLFNADAVAQVLTRMLRDKVDLPLTPRRDTAPPKRGEAAPGVATWSNHEGDGGGVLPDAGSWSPQPLPSSGTVLPQRRAGPTPSGDVRVNAVSQQGGPYNKSSTIMYDCSGPVEPSNQPLVFRENRASGKGSSIAASESSSDGVFSSPSSPAAPIAGTGKGTARPPPPHLDDWEARWSRLYQRSEPRASGGGASSSGTAATAAAGWLDMAYLTDRRFYTDGNLPLTSILARASSAGIRDVVALCTGLASTRDALELAHHWRGTLRPSPSSSPTRLQLSRDDYLSRYPGLPLPRLWATAGIHPTFVEHCGDVAMGALERLVGDNLPLVAAIGECGLDLADRSGDTSASIMDEPREARARHLADKVSSMAARQRKQALVLEQQIALARRWNRPIVLWGGGHAQDADAEDDDTAATRKQPPAFQHELLMDVLTRHKGWLLQGNALVHGFVGTPEQADDLVSLGAYIGLSPALCNMAGGMFYVPPGSRAQGVPHGGVSSALEGSTSIAGVAQLPRLQAAHVSHSATPGTMTSAQPSVTTFVASYVREVVRRIPLDRLVISTGAPVPLLQSIWPRPPISEPLFLPDVAEELVRLSGAAHGRTRAELLRVSAQNARMFYGLGVEVL
eukprot:jgi/Mesvir1/11585/Mv00001-RA.1